MSTKKGRGVASRATRNPWRATMRHWQAPRPPEERGPPLAILGAARRACAKRTRTKFVT
jgi:hypothetical protein